jgi:hypothetical protein
MPKRRRTGPCRHVTTYGEWYNCVGTNSGATCPLLLWGEDEEQGYWFCNRCVPVLHDLAPDEAFLCPGCEPQVKKLTCVTCQAGETHQGPVIKGWTSLGFQCVTCRSEIKEAKQEEEEEEDQDTEDEEPVSKKRAEAAMLFSLANSQPPSLPPMPVVPIATQQNRWVQWITWQK